MITLTIFYRNAHAVVEKILHRKKTNQNAGQAIFWVLLDGTEKCMDFITTEMSLRNEQKTLGVKWL